MGHPVYGASWESFALENIIATLPRWRTSFFRTASGAEIDLILEKGNRKVAVECKASTSPSVERGFWNALDALAIEEAWIIAGKRGVSQQTRSHGRILAPFPGAHFEINWPLNGTTGKHRFA